MVEPLRPRSQREKVRKLGHRLDYMVRSYLKSPKAGEAAQW